MYMFIDYKTLSYSFVLFLFTIIDSSLITNHSLALFIVTIIELFTCLITIIDLSPIHHSLITKHPLNNKILHGLTEYASARH